MYYFVVYRSTITDDIFEEVINVHPLDYLEKFRTKYNILFWSEITKKLYEKHRGAYS